MAEIGIDQSKLPGVKEVCRDFAVLEDHTLAHSLQEQEIEHHLATNVQRNRLVQHDLQVARLLQEEEDRKAQACVQERRKDIERQDCEIAQEIQVKLVIEAEQQRRRQEEDDEDIARILQQKELREEKRRKKPPAEPLPHGPCGKGSPPESRDHPCGNRGQETSACRGSPPPRRGERQPGEHRRGPPMVSEGLDLEVLGSASSEGRKAKGGQRHRREQRERKPGSRVPAGDPKGDGFDRGGGGGSRCTDDRESQPGGPRGPAGLILDGELECADGGRGGGRERQERRPRSRERTRGLPPPVWGREGEGPNLDCDRTRRKHPERPLPSPERSRGAPSSVVEEDRNPGRRRSTSRSPNAARHRLPREGRPAPRSPRQPSLQDAEVLDWPGPRKDVGREQERAGHGARAFPRRGEDWETGRGRQRSPGTKSRSAKEAAYQKPRLAAQGQELYDAEIARKLQEEELLASQVDKRAVQVAQDEEIARLLMAEEKKAYRKAKDREKGSLEKKRRDQDWKHDANELARPRSREGHEPHRPRSDKPTRPPPPFTEDPDHLSSLASQQHSVHETSRPDPSHKGFRYKQ